MHAYRRVFASAIAASGSSNAPGTGITVIDSRATPASSSSASAPSSSLAVTAPLKRLTTTPTERRAPFGRTLEDAVALGNGERARRMLAHVGRPPAPTGSASGEASASASGGRLSAAGSASTAVSGSALRGSLRLDQRLVDLERLALRGRLLRREVSRSPLSGGSVEPAPLVTRAAHASAPSKSSRSKRRSWWCSLCPSLSRFESR